MVIPVDAIPKTDWERAEKGLPPVPKKVIKKPEPEMPDVPNHLKVTDIKITPGLKLLSKRMETVKNADGVSFTGFRVQFEVEVGVTTEGWLADGDYYRLKPHFAPNTDEAILLI
jgi:hypothetical protein